MSAGLLDTSVVIDWHDPDVVRVLPDEMSYGLVVAAVVQAGRRPRGRGADLLIAATAHANGRAPYTRDAAAFVTMEELIRVIDG